MASWPQQLMGFLPTRPSDLVSCPARAHQSWHFLQGRSSHRQPPLKQAPTSCRSAAAQGEHRWGYGDAPCHTQSSPGEGEGIWLSVNQS